MGDEIEALPEHTDTWCIFDNTASGAAIENALEMMNCSRQQTTAVPLTETISIPLFCPSTS